MLPYSNGVSSIPTEMVADMAPAILTARQTNLDASMCVLLVSFIGTDYNSPTEMCLFLKILWKVIEKFWKKYGKPLLKM